ncbi:hypothetical protein M0R45_027433 [Rubus argutus]|uniref:Uncharacterized protein n=1 Tax=Rubus argutus TaxID=59490 RepID=A0AAW1X1T2_RUBAR
MHVLTTQDAKGREVAASIGSDRCTYIHCDVTDEEQVKSLVDSTVQLYGRLDVMYSNEGIGAASEQTVLELDLSKFDKVMVEKGVRGSIVCTASFVAECGTDGKTDYTMLNHAVLGLVMGGAWGSPELRLPGSGGDAAGLRGFEVWGGRTESDN